MKDLKIDDLLDVTINGARLMYTVPDHSEGARAGLTQVSYGGTLYVLIADTDHVTISKVAPDDMAEPTTMAVKPGVSDERVQEIVDKLNGFVDYGPGYLDTNLTKAVDWAAEQIGPDSLITNAFGPDTDGSAEVELANGAVIKWLPTAKQWAVTVSDDTDSEVSQ